MIAATSTSSTSAIPKVVRVTPEGEATEFADVPGAGGNGHIAFARGGF